MKITGIRTAVLRIVGPCVIVKIDTDEGITGLGECYPAAPASAIVETIRAMSEHLTGVDPRNINPLHEKIRRFNLFTGAQGGTVITALSGVEMALWDVLGKWLGVPVYQLLGGNNPRVPAYASTVTWDTMDEYEQHIKECMDEGFFAFKLHATGDAKWDAQLAHNLRKWVGPDADLMFAAVKPKPAACVWRRRPNQTARPMAGLEALL